MLDFFVIAVFGLVTFSSIVLFYHHYLALWLTRESQRQCSLGGLFGIGTVLLMLHPVEIAPGLLLDARFLLIGFAGLLTGWRGIVIALTLSITTRLFIGGQGALVGCLTLLLSAGIGLAWRSLQGKLTFGPFWRFLAFGAALSLSLITVTLFPEPSRASAITKALPFLVVLNMVGGLIAGYLNISVREVAKSRAYTRQLALFDELTGLPNRSSLISEIDKRFNQLDAQGTSFAALSLDIDNFRNINSTLGHKIGDKLLISAAKRFRQFSLQNETLARVEADEFVVLIPGNSITGILDRANQFLETSRKPHEIDGSSLTITASAGLVWASGGKGDSRTLLQNAEIAMFQSKKMGRNRATIFDQTIRDNLERQASLSHALRLEVADAKGLSLVFQPQFSLEDQTLIGAEVLLRWHHPEFGNVSPNEFIPVAENSGLIRTLDRLVFTMATKQLAEWMKLGFEPRLSINISVQSLIVEGTADQLLSIFESEAIPSHLIAIEVTESESLAGSIEALENIEKFRAAGIDIELDDFGTGHSSMTYLQRLPVTGLKIDQSFVKNIDNGDGRSEPILLATINLARTMDLKLTAEGVESESQLNWLRLQKCDVAQGYLLGKPVDKEQFFSRHCVFQMPTL